MDRQNLSFIRRSCPVSFNGYLGLLLDFLEENNLYDVPDPYYSGDQGFEIVLDLVFEAVENLFQHILKHHI